MKVDKETLEFCMNSLQKVLNKEGQVTACGITYDGFPMYANLTGSRDAINQAMQQILEEDKKNHERERNQH